MAKILVAADELDLREAITLALEAAGHSITETASGLEAITLAGRGRFDLVMLDVDLEELRGPAVARVIRDLGPVPIVAMSGRRDDWQSEMLASGATACLPKPFDMYEMLSPVRSIVRTRSRAGQRSRASRSRPRSRVDLRLEAHGARAAARGSRSARGAASTSAMTRRAGEPILRQALSRVRLPSLGSIA